MNNICRIGQRLLSAASALLFVPLCPLSAISDTLQIWAGNIKPLPDPLLFQWLAWHSNIGVCSVLSLWITECLQIFVIVCHQCEEWLVCYGCFSLVYVILCWASPFYYHSFVFFPLASVFHLLQSVLVSSVVPAHCLRTFFIYMLHRSSTASAFVVMNLPWPCLFPVWWDNSLFVITSPEHFCR